jgi:tight adherence protein C
MVLFAAITASLAVFVGVYTLVSPGRPRAVATRLDRFERGAVSDRDAVLAAPFASRVGIPLLQRSRDLLRRILPTSWVAGIERRLLLAGEPVSLHAFLTVQIATAASAAIVVIGGIAAGITGLRLLAVVVCAVILGGMPFYWLRAKVAMRKKSLLRALPDAVDLIVTTVEAGLAIDAALAEVGRETKGPLGEELRLTVRETTLGRSRRDALQRLVERTAVPELKTFVQAIVQAEQTGIPIGQVLRTQAAQIRVRKRQHAEAEAQRAPVKMVVVLVLLVLPSLLMLVMGPAIMRMTDQLG